MARNFGKAGNGKGGGSDSQYKKDYCDLLIKHMSQGYSFSSFGAEVNHGRSTLLEWLDKFPEFKEAKEIGHEKAKKFFEKIARMKLRGESTEKFDPKRSDTALLIFFLKTRFRDEYTEKIEISNSNDEALRILYTIDKNAS